MRRSPNLQVMVQAAQKAARALARDFGEVEQLQVSLKGPGDFVTAADRRAEQIITDELRRARPNFAILAEEGGEETAESGARWIVDPLDGTTNFLHGLPHFAISIACEMNGELVAAVVLDPIKQELFTADRGQGAWMNGRRLRVSARKELERAMVACGMPVLDWEGRERGFMGQLDRVSARVAGIRRWGAASLDLAYIAAGRYDGFWEFGLKPWDVAAGIVLIREAGGQIARLEGDGLMERGTLVAANPQLHPQLTALVAG
ncbi:MAG: inositol monophosphatase [Alphaproteobacteria bacterium]|jgi:myo-inositol-1(or 4)-monophosphatase|nr:inositol monophosphatase [Alphaproteobacteria bacterium]